MKLLAMSVMVASSVAAADDLDLIPDSVFDDEVEIVAQPPSNAYSKIQSKLRLQSQFTQSQLLASDDDWQQSYFTSLNVRGEHGGKNRLIFDSTLRVNGVEGVDFELDDNLQLDIKELYLSHKINASDFFDIGRINIRNGVAFGFNPSDFYKASSIVDQTDRSARERRNNRLGLIALRYETSSKGNNLNFIYSPKLDVSEGGFLSDKDSIGQRLHHSNATEKASVTFTRNSDQGYSNQGSLFYNDGTVSAAANTSFVLTPQLLAYGEWRIQKSRSIAADYIHQANAQGVEIEPLIEQAYADVKKNYQNQLVAGLSWSSANNMTTRFEYHYSQLAMDEADWASWHRLRDNRALEKGLWEIRDYFRSQSELLNTHGLWLRSEWSDMWQDFSPGLMVNYNPEDNSAMAQLFFTYIPSDNVILELSAMANSGVDDSSYGSLPVRQLISTQLNWYF